MNSLVSVSATSTGQQGARPIILTGVSRPTVTTTGGGQKLVVLQQRAQTPVASISGNAVQQSLVSQQQIKITQSVSGTQKTLATGQKLVVVCMPSSSAGTSTISQVICFHD